MSDPVVLALLVPGGQHGSVAAQGVEGRLEDSPKHHPCHEGHSRVLAPGVRTEPRTSRSLPTSPENPDPN